MKAEAVTAIVTGLKQAGINFITSLPSSPFGFLILTIMDDADFIHVPVASESDAIGICGGASLAGKKPAVILQNSGLVLASYPLMDLLAKFGGFPTLLVVDHSGDFGDECGYFFFSYGLQTLRTLENFEIPYTIVRESNKLTAEIVRAEKTTEAYGKPAAILINREVMS